MSGKFNMAARVTARKQNLVLRDLHKNDTMFHISSIKDDNLHEIITLDINKSKRNYKFRTIGAFKNHANGELMGFIAYDPNNNIIGSLYTCGKNDEVTQSLLLDDAILHMKGKYQINIVGKYINNESRDVLKPIIKNRSSGICMSIDQYKKILLMKEPQPSYTHTLKKLTMNCRIKYIPNIGQESHERHPTIHFHLSNNVGKTPFIINMNKTKEFDRNINLMFDISTSIIPSNCLLNVDIFTQELNENEQWCYNQAGYANIRFEDFVRERKALLILKVPNSTNNDIMGKIYLDLGSNNIMIQNSSQQQQKQMITFDYKYNFSQVQKKFKDDEKDISSYIQKNRQFYSQHPSTYRSIDRVTVFVYNTRPGYTIGSLFDLFPIGDTKEIYFLNALSIVVGRRSSQYSNTKIDLLSDQFFKSKNEKYKCALAMDMLCLYVNYCPYITDEVDHNKKSTKKNWSENLVELIESFDILRARNAGDCEDSTREILQEAMEIKYHNKPFQSSVMREVKRLLHYFIFTSVLCGVSNKSMNGSENNQNMQLNGHEAAFAIPKAIFYTALKRYDKKKCSLLQYVSPSEQKLGSHLSIYVLEGTGDLQPEPSKQSEKEKFLANVLLQESSKFGKYNPMKNATSTYHYDPFRSDNFYKVMITLLTPEFFFKFGYPVFEFLLCYSNTHKSYSGLIRKEYTRGVLFTDLIQIEKKTNVCIAPAPKINPSILKASSDITKDDYPILPLDIPNYNIDLCNIARQLNSDNIIYDSNKMTPISQHIGKNVVHKIYIKFNDMKSFHITGLRKIAIKFNLKFFCRLEPVRKCFDGSNIGGYEITFISQ